MKRMSASLRVVAVPALVLWLGVAGCASFEGARLYRSGTSALDRGEPERAVADLERAAALVPQASEVQNHLGLAYAAVGRPQDAERAFRRAVELDCRNAAARENLRAAELHVAERRGAVAKP
jgi:Flp pilus assembly protein TadD